MVFPFKKEKEYGDYYQTGPFSKLTFLGVERGDCGRLSPDPCTLLFGFFSGGTVLLVFLELELGLNLLLFRIPLAGLNKDVKTKENRNGEIPGYKSGPYLLGFSIHWKWTPKDIPNRRNKNR